MRYLSLLFIVAVMSWSWGFMKSPLEIPETTHIDIQDDIKMMIGETMQKYLPTVTGFRFDRFWTQNLSKDKVKAVFAFSFENSAETEEPARYGVEGYAILTYDNEKNIWNVDGPYFYNNEITFKEGMTIHPGSDDGE